MALLMAQVEPDTIHLVGRWMSNTMLRYLHTTGKSFADGRAVKIFQDGTRTIISPAHARN